jgi:P27 family predicted phage terminase small subunit
MVRGRRQEPTEEHILNGTFRADRHSDPATEAKPPEGRPKTPDNMPENVRVIWEEILQQLEEMGILSPIYGIPLTRYCYMVSRWRDVVQWIEENGVTVEGQHGPKTAPQVAIERNLCSELVKLEKEFGLTPATRSGLKIFNPKPEKKAVASRRDHKRGGQN